MYDFSGGAHRISWFRSVSNILPTIEFMSSADTVGQDDLLIVRCKRCQPESPVFLVKFDWIADIKISTFIFKAAPEPVLAVYDFVMTTFVSGPDQQQQQASTRLMVHQYAY